ncbi:putative bifunctional diguanylate cyclase/phosphodiesterase [Roseococcus suduntuyensis]|uniref:Diguanylate cyclase (GGDEF)-like protein n=1 Tax=Roseococcus suduntuyensis TaxID=455361 RepID=A0A840A8E2_9PROT|nr:EAL domain-containing protein [Roseococcus suduntuyensis]MBB3898328.1 diguanylate cyclase (GGDEF)-like protein [Roseococcus suduntuyensis]
MRPRRRRPVTLPWPFPDVISAPLPARPAPRGRLAPLLPAGFLAGLLLGALMGWPWRGAVASGLLGSLLTWVALREIALRDALAVLRVMPCHALVMRPDRRPLWQAGSGPSFTAAEAAGREEDRLRTAHGHLPPHAREAMVNAGLDAHLRADGTPQCVQDAQGRWFERRQFRLPGGGTVCFSAEITETRQREQSLAGSEARLLALLEHAPVGLWKLDAHGRTLFANARLRRLFQGEVPSRFPRDTLPQPTPTEGIETVLPLPDGTERPVLLGVVPWDPPGGAPQGRLLSVLDLGALRHAQARLAHLSEHDPLTGLANRATFQAALAAMAEDPKGGVVMLVDLDAFAQHNDRHGHAVGDALLREAAHRLRGALCPSDLVCRTRGDEFAVLAFEAGAHAAPALAGRVRAALRTPLRAEGREVPVTASIGLAVAPQHGGDPATLLRAAGLAVIEAKEMGGDTVSLFTHALRERDEQRARLREALAAALEAEELELHLQPQRNLENGSLAGVEALLRWNSPRLGRWVAPAEILSAAAELGLVGRLDRQVLRRAVQLLAGWPGPPPCLAINISVSTLHDQRFAEEVRDALHAARVAPGRLEIEIPEDLAVRDLPAVHQTLTALREVGVTLALDDFGSGHSGLPHVVRLPVQRLKLDRSIVAQLPEDAKAMAVLRATMALARGMGIEVVGEGVETEAQATSLHEAGCHVIQGWLIARPMPVEAFLASLPPPLLLPAPAQTTRVGAGM